MISLRRGHFRRVLYRLQFVLGRLRQVARAHPEAVLIVCRVRDRLQYAVRVDIGVS